MAIQNATTTEARLAAIENLLTKFADTEFKPFVLQLAAQVCQQSGDWDKSVLYAERALEANPKDYVSTLLLADYYASRTRANDLDKDEKLAKADKYANTALELLKTGDKFRPDLTDEQWASLKKDFIANAHADLGQSAALRKKYDVAIAEYKTAVEGAGTPSGEMLVRAGSVNIDGGKYDDGIALLDRAANLPDVHPQTKQIALSEKARAQKLKAGGGKPAGAAGAPQIEIKK